jgi:hypothetical protein
MKKITLILIFTALLLSGAGCQKADDSQGVANYIKKDPQSGDGFTLFTDNALFNQYSATANEGQPFKIDSVTRQDDMLIVTVSYSANCSVPAFDVVWDGRVMLSYPYKINLVMKMKANNCAGNGQEINTQVTIDLKKYIGDAVTDKNTVFSVIDASTKADTVYPTQHN